MQQLADGVTVTYAPKFGEVLLCGRARRIINTSSLSDSLWHLIPRPDGLKRTVSGKTSRDKSSARRSYAHCISSDARTKSPSNSGPSATGIQRHHVVLSSSASAAAPRVSGWQARHDYNVLAKLGYHVRQLAHAEPVEQGCAGKFVTRRTPRMRECPDNPETLREYVSAPSLSPYSAIGRVSSSAPDRLLY